MCHLSCATCFNQEFTGCLSCPKTNILIQSSCYCAYPWSPDCTTGKKHLFQEESSFQNIFRPFQSFYVLTFILLIILYCLKIKLPLSYRCLSGLQFMSLLIYSPTFYLQYEDFFVMRFFNLLSGPYLIDYRLQAVSTMHAVQTYVLLGFFIFLLLILYFPSQTFIKKQQSFWQYLKQFSLQYLQNFYYFGGKMMFVVIGMVIMNGFSSLEMIIHLVIFCIIILAVIVRLIMEYHKNQLSEEIFQAPLYIYCMLTNLAGIGIPLIAKNTMLVIIFLAPLGLLGFIIVLNKEVKVVDANNIKFCVVEVVMSAINVTVILVEDSIRTYILLLTLILCAALFSIEMGMVYYGGIDYYTSSSNQKGTDSKVQPEAPITKNDSNNQIDVLEQQKNSMDLNNFVKNASKRKGKYF